MVTDCRDNYYKMLRQSNNEWLHYQAGSTGGESMKCNGTYIATCVMPNKELKKHQNFNVGVHSYLIVWVHKYGYLVATRLVYSFLRSCYEAHNENEIY